jgi:hypothetical protein
VYKTQKDDGAEFQPHLAAINDLSIWPVPRQCPSGTQMSTHTSGLSSTSSNTMQPPGQSSNPSIPSGLPPYVHHLQSKWRESGTSPVTPERYRLRTWYIHHVHNPTWKIPRLVELHTDPLQWHHDILQQWRDQLHSDAVLNIAVVFPEVRALRQAQACGRYSYPGGS